MISFQFYAQLIGNNHYSLFKQTADVFSTFILVQLISNMVMVACCIFQMDLVNLFHLYRSCTKKKKFEISKCSSLFKAHATRLGFNISPDDLFNIDWFVEFVSVLLFCEKFDRFLCTIC